MKLKTILSVLISLGLTSVANAQESHQPEGVKMLGISSKNIKTSAALANMLGIEYLNYHSDTFFMGGAVYTGQLSAGATGAVSFGGILAGTEIFKFSPVGMTFTVLLGAGGGFSATNGGGFLVDPTVGFTLSSLRRSKGSWTSGTHGSPARPLIPVST